MVQNVAPSSVVFPREHYYLPNCLSHSVPRMYANDTHLTYSNGYIRCIQSSLNENLRNYSYDKEQLPTVVKITHNYTSLTSLILFVFRANFFITVNRTFLSPAYRFAFLGTCFSVTRRSKTIKIFIYIFLISLSRTLDCGFFKRPQNLWNGPANACCWKCVYGEHLRCGKFTPQAQDYLNHKFDPWEWSDATLYPLS